MTQRVRHTRQGLRHRHAERGVAVADAPNPRHGESLRPLLHEVGQRLVGGGEEAAGEEPRPRETIAPAPKPCMAPGGLATIEGEDDAPAGLREALEAGRIVQ